jgi:segregation and condensation protein B
MSAEELPPAEDVEEPAAVAAVDELSAAKEKFEVEDTEKRVSSAGGGGSNDEDSDDDDSDDDADDDSDDDVSGDSNDGEDGKEIKDVAAEAIESPAAAGTAPEVIDGSDASADEDSDRESAGNEEAADPEGGNDSTDSEGDETRGGVTEAVESPALATPVPEVAEGSESSEEGEEPKDIEEVVAEAVETPTSVVAAPPPQVTDVVSSDHVQHLRLLEALLFAGTQALDDKELADRLPNDADLPRLLADLAELYANRGINLVKVAGGYAFRTAPDLSEKLKIERPVTRKLSRASVETLAIIAYHQPVTRAEIEQVRGVGLSKGTLDLLFEQNWIKPMGRRRAPGKPVTWGTTDFFLEHFGLSSLDDLPGHEEMRAAGLLDPRAQPPIFRPEEPDLPLEPTEDEAVEPLAVEEQGTPRATEPQ